MASSSRIRVGIIGLSPNRGFASIAHIPALRALPQFEIAAVCTTRQESAEATAKHFGIPLAFSDPGKLAQHPDVDLVTVTVKVPDHYDPVMAAIEAGKHVYCEWPLGRNTGEAQQMLDAAARKGVRHAVGLQGQLSPTVNYVKDLVAEGYVGRVLTASLLGCAPNWGATLDRSYQADFANGANLMTITGGHQIDALCHCLGEFREVSAFAVSQRDRVVTEDQGEVPLTAPDQLAVSGILGCGAVVSFQIRGGMTRGTEFLFEIHGSDGDLVLGATTGGSMQRQELSLRSAQGKGTKLAELPIPAKYRYVPENTPASSPYNVAQLYAKLGQSIRDGTPASPASMPLSGGTTSSTRSCVPRKPGKSKASAEERRTVDFSLTAEQQRLQRQCRDLATDFATRSAAHDRDASHPVENYNRLREAGFLALTVGKEWGGQGASFLDHTIAYEALGAGCPSTALAFNMHASVVMPLLQSHEVFGETKQRIADLVVSEGKLIAGNFSEPVTTSLIGERPLKARARRAEGGYRVSGRKMFASMLEAADFVLVMAYPDEATSPSAGMILMLPRVAEGRGVDANWDVLGMRATRSDSLILDECWLPENAAVLRSDDMRRFRHDNLNWFWGSYTPVYLGVAQAAFDELRRVMHERKPEGHSQPLAYHPDVRRHIAEMSADLEAARLITYRSAWLSDRQGPTAETTAALYRAKYAVGEAVSRITRTALTLGGAHGIFKTSRLEQLFRDGALGPLHPPPADFCLYNMGLYELGLDPAEVTPPLKPA